MGINFYFPWEVNLIIFIQNILLKNNSLIYTMIVLTYFGEPLASVLFLAFFYFGYDKEFGKRMGIAVLGANVFNNYLKNIIKRRRPYFDNENVKNFKTVDSKYDQFDVIGQGFSFPSGHTTNATVLMGSLYKYFKNKIVLIIAIVISILVATSRFSLGVHYPTDTICGLLIGLSGLFVFDYGIKKFGKKRFYLVYCLLCATGFFFCKSNDYYSTLGLLIGFCLADLYEEKYVNFNNTKNLKTILLRMIFGILIFLIIAEGPKLIIPSAIMNSNDLLSYFIRFLRYGLAIFISMGVYPKLFKYKLFR